MHATSTMPPICAFGSNHISCLCWACLLALPHRAHALYAQLQLQSQQQAAVDVPLLNTFMSLLRRCTWSHGGPFGVGQQQQQHPLHVSCFGCGMRPILGPRFRSKGNYDINMCSRCLDTPQAADAAPYEEVTGEALNPCLSAWLPARPAMSLLAHAADHNGSPHALHSVEALGVTFITQPPDALGC